MVLNQILLILGMLAGGLCVYFIASSFFGSLLTKNNSTSLVWGESADLPKQSRSPIITLTRPLVHKVAIPLLSRYKLEEYKKGIKRNIYAAGLGQELNEDEYIGLQLLMGILLPVFVSMTNILFNLEYPWIVIILFGVMGFAFPHFYVKGHKSQRTAQVLVDLPFVVDLLSLSIEAGSDFIGAIQRVTEKMSGGALAEELSQVLRDLKLGSSRSEALNAMAWRMNMLEVSSFIAVLTTADTLGASVGGVLRQQSEQMRQERFTRAEKAGTEASQKIYMPLVLFILPAVLLMVFGPIILQFMGGSP